MKDRVLNRLVEYIRVQQLARGAKLPAERDLADLLNVSRATIRETLRLLEARRVITVKRGSGAYLAISHDSSELTEPESPRDEAVRLENLLEARYLLAPAMIRTAAERAAEHEIALLRRCIVDMSRAIVSRDIELLADSDREFHRVLSLMTSNHAFINIMKELNADNRLFWECFLHTDEFANNVIFSGYVEIVNAIKRKDPADAARHARKNIRDAREWISRIKNIHFQRFNPPPENGRENGNAG